MAIVSDVGSAIMWTICHEFCLEDGAGGEETCSHTTTVHMGLVRMDMIMWAHVILCAVFPVKIIDWLHWKHNLCFTCPPVESHCFMMVMSILSVLSLKRRLNMYLDIWATIKFWVGAIRLQGILYNLALNFHKRFEGVMRHSSFSQPIHNCHCKNVKNSGRDF